MTEQYKPSLSAEKRVFGDVFSLQTGRFNRALEMTEVGKRLEQINRGETVWLSRDLDADGGVVADLYTDKRLVATMEYDYATRLADVFASQDSTDVPRACLAVQLPFEEAVVLAEDHALGIRL